MTESELKEFSKLRSDNEVLREHLRTVNPEMSAYLLKIQGLKDALELARAELQKERLDSLSADSQAYESYAQARVLAMEEACRKVFQFMDGGRVLVVDDDFNELVNSISAIAPFPASLVAVPRETVGKVREALMVGMDISIGIQMNGEPAQRVFRSALKALDEVSK